MIHVPVLLNSVVEVLALKTGGTYVDCTIGRGGHAEAILKAIGSQGLVVGLDQDEEALGRARERLLVFGERCLVRKANFRDIRGELEKLGIREAHGILLDLGMSSEQLGDPARGFSFQEDGPLDMRMDLSGALTAAEVVNEWPESKLFGILKDFGEERWAGRIARTIMRQRGRKRIETTSELVSAILKGMPRGRRRIHPATRSFQAIRMAVNEELENLRRGLEGAVECLSRRGRLCVISYHSLEDRIVKQYFRQMSREGIVTDLTRKPIIPDKAEMQQNPRSRSAKLRAVEKI
ncbi:MAG: 16S rRNA (cytosine(1402)-N(4))-methyltransferase RsmH [Armatimonadetes bacterium]|nr:16S rRNA (cytosine(1402)-N(4))-methyltransferase RsmH [Armatimonadota bacterium]